MGKYDGKTIHSSETRTYNFQYGPDNSRNVSKETTVSSTASRYTKDTTTTKANGDVDRYHEAYIKR